MHRGGKHVITPLLPSLRNVKPQALRAAGDMSEAALDATERVLNYNCDSYTMWNYRREVLEAMFAQIYAAGGAVRRGTRVGV